MRTRLAPADVERYARAIVFDALKMKPGDRLFVNCEAYMELGAHSPPCVTARASTSTCSTTSRWCCVPVCCTHPTS